MAGNAIFQPQAVAYAITDATIAEWADRYMALRVDGVDDSEGLKTVHEARMAVKRTRVGIEHRRKELKAEALEYGRVVDTEARRLTAMISPVEEHLQAEESRVTEERARLKAEKIERERAEVQARVDELAEHGATVAFHAVAAMSSDEYYAAVHAAEKAQQDKCEAEAAAEAERAKLQAEADARHHAEQEQLDRERAQAEAERAKLQDERAKLDRVRTEQEAEAKRLADEKAAAERKIELDRARVEAAAQAKREAEDRARQEIEDAKAREEAAAAAKARVEALRPDQEKLDAFADAVVALVVPELNDHDVWIAVRDVLATAAERIRQLQEKVA